MRRLDDLQTTGRGRMRLNVPVSESREMESGRELYALQGSSIPKGLRPPAQGCEERATLGERCWEIHNPNGVATASLVSRLASMSRNPVGVGNSSPRLPRVARDSQPWALRRNPVGIEFANATPLGFIKPHLRSQDARRVQRPLPLWLNRADLSGAFNQTPSEIL